MSLSFAIDRRGFLAAAAALAATPLRAQAFPNRQMQLVVPFAAGGAADIIGRAVTERLSQT